MANEDPRYLAWIRSQPCAMCGKKGGAEAHHSPFGKGMSQRGHDYTCVPLCHVHHMDFHNVSGPFKGWNKEHRRLWQRDTALSYRAQYKLPPPPWEADRPDWDDIF